MDKDLIDITLTAKWTMGEYEKRKKDKRENTNN